MELERRGRVIAVECGPTGTAGRSPMVQRKAAAFVRWHEPCEARVSRTVLWGAQGEIPWAYPALITVWRLPTICLKLKEQRTLSCGLARGLCAISSRYALKSPLADEQSIYRERGMHFASEVIALIIVAAA